MSRTGRLIVEASISAALAAGMALTVNMVSDGWSWKWIMVLVVFASASAAFRVWELLKRDPGAQVVPHQPSEIRGRHLVLCVAILGLLGAFAVVWAVPRTQTNPILATPEESCQYSANDPFPKLDYYCEISWAGRSTIPLHPTPSGVRQYGELRAKAGLQYFMCQTLGDPISWNGRTGSYRALTQGDKDKVWGYFPQVYFAYGSSNRKDGRMRECTEKDKEYAGTSWSQT